MFIAKQLLPEEFPQGGVLYGAMVIVGIFMGEKILRQYFQGIFLYGEVSLNRPNHSTTMQIFQRSQYTFYVANTSRFKLVQIIQRFTNHST